MTQLEGKRCRKCDEWKPFSEFHKNRRAKDNHHLWCKSCVSRYNKDYYAKNREAVLAGTAQYRKQHPDQVAACKRDWRERNAESVRLRHKEYYEQNKDEIQERRRLYRQEHPEIVRVWEQRYYNTHKTKIIEYKRKWAIENADRKHATDKAYYQRHREARIAYVKSWRAENPDKVYATLMRRRKRLQELEGSHTYDEWTALVAEWDFCPCCCKPWSEVGSPTVDHIVPLNWEGATDNISGIQPLCRSCNSSKGDRHATDYIHGVGMLQSLTPSQSAPNTSIKERDD